MRIQSRQRLAALILLTALAASGCGTAPSGKDRPHDVALQAADGGPGSGGAGGSGEVPGRDGSDGEAGNVSVDPEEPPADPKLEEALEPWSDFPVDADPRPLVLLSTVEKTPDGFDDGALKDAFEYGTWPAPDRLPTSPKRAYGYPIVSATDALQTLREVMGGPAKGGRNGHLVVSDVHLGRADITTDRGKQKLPAWFVSFHGARGEAIIPAVAMSARYERGFPPGSAFSEGQVTVDAGDHVLTFPYGGNVPGPCGADFRLEVAESAQAVVYRAVPMPHAAADSPTDHPMACDAMARSQPASVTLAAPLGARLVVGRADQYPYQVVHK